jgi:flagellar hook protein FlgE
MFNSFSTALTALTAQSTAVNVVGSNLANLNTPGFKGTTIAFRDLLSASSTGGQTMVGLGLSTPLTFLDQTQGAIDATGGRFDAAVQGEGFFVVMNGAETLYTRAGNFHVNRDGYLVTASGYRVQGYGVDAGTGEADDTLADIRIENLMPETGGGTGGGTGGAATPNVLGIAIVDDGYVTVRYSDGTETPAFQLGLARFPNPSELYSVGNNSFAMTTRSGDAFVGHPNASGLGKVIGGAVEGSNVDIARALTDLLTYQRGYQASSKIITASDELTQDTLNLVR